MADILQLALNSISLEDDEPIDLPDSPRFKLFCDNSVSLLGRLLNPSAQKMERMIEVMPQMWRVYDRVQGIALSKERFQFIFQREEDIQTVLKDCPWSFNNWTMLQDRWVDSPPSDFLTSVDVWARLYNIPRAYSSLETINKLAKSLGKVDVVEFNPDASQHTKYIRVKVNIGIDRPFPPTKTLNLSVGGSVLIKVEYERIRKRCFKCYIITHEDKQCPLMKSQLGLGGSPEPQRTSNAVIRPFDEANRGNGSFEVPPGFQPMFPSLSREDHRMAMQYISHSDPTERLARIECVHQTIERDLEASSNQMPKIILRESSSVDKIFDFKYQADQEKFDTNAKSCRVLSEPVPDLNYSINKEVSSRKTVSPFMVSGPISNQFDYVKNLSAGTTTKKQSTRKRAPAWKHKVSALSAKNKNPFPDPASSYLQAKDPDGSTTIRKRKADLPIDPPVAKSPKNQEQAVASGLKPLKHQ